MSYANALQIVQSHGRAAASFQALTSNLQYWIEGDACVAYAEVGGAWVAVGGPIAPPEREAEVTRRFVLEAERRKKRVRFFAVERELPHTALDALHIGEQPVWDPREWPNSLPKKLRGQLRRDRAKAVVNVRRVSQAEIDSPDNETRRGIDRVIAHWLDSRKMAPMDFMVRMDPYHLASERRFFVAEHEGNVVAALIAIPVYARNGWFLETMLRHPSAPNGTVELLFDAAMQNFADEGSTYVTFGLCPLAGSDSSLLRFIRWGTRSLYNFDGLRRFKGKLGPACWEPIYLAYPKGDSTVLAMVDALRAFLPGGFFGFGWSTMVQRARTVAASIAALLVPWTILVALADSAHWFPSRAVHAAWVLFDLVLVAGFASLAKNFRRKAALSLMALTALDFVASLTQFLSFNAERARGGDWLFSLIAIFGPLLASAFLFASRNRRQLYSPSSWQERAKARRSTPPATVVAKDPRPLARTGDRRRPAPLASDSLVQE